MSEPDAVMTRIGQGIGMRERGQRSEARVLFAELWDEIGGQGADPLHRCALAHSMADVQDDARDELSWDLRALQAADDVTDQRIHDGGIDSTAAGFYPSLHLNLGDCYRRLGDTDLARVHLQRGRDTIGLLAGNPYGDMIRHGLDRLARRLNDCEATQ